MNGTVVRVRRVKSAHFLFFFRSAQRKDFRRGRSKSVHGSAVILLRVSPGGNVSLGNHGTLFGVSGRVFYAAQRAKRGEKWTRTSDVGAASCCYFPSRKGGDLTEKERGSVCAGCRGFQLPVSPNKVSPVLSLPSLGENVEGFSRGFPNVFASCQRGQLQGPRRL